MLIKNATEKEINAALAEVNAEFGDNVQFAKFTTLHETRHRVTLRVKSSKESGASRGYRGRRLINACWHVHGRFIDALPKAAEIYAAGVWTYPGATWRDWNAGFQMEPRYASEKCECTE